MYIKIYIVRGKQTTKRMEDTYWLNENGITESRGKTRKRIKQMCYRFVQYCMIGCFFTHTSLAYFISTIPMNMYEEWRLNTQGQKHTAFTTSAVVSCAIILLYLIWPTLLQRYLLSFFTLSIVMVYFSCGIFHPLNHLLHHRYRHRHHHNHHHY